MKDNLIVFKVRTSSLTSPAGDLDPEKIKKLPGSWPSCTRPATSWSW